MTGGSRTAQSGLFWPSEQQRELLVVTLGEPLDAVSAWERLQPRFVLDELEPGSFDLMALAYHQLSAAGYHDPVVERMKSIYRREWVRANVQRKLTTEVATMLGELGVRALFIEGATLADRFFPTPGVRPSWSIDVFVEEEAAATVLAGLADAGWSRAPWSTNADASGPWGLVNGERSVCSVRTSFGPRPRRPGCSGAAVRGDVGVGRALPSRRDGAPRRRAALDALLRLRRWGAPAGADEPAVDPRRGDDPQRRGDRLRPARRNCPDAGPDRQAARGARLPRRAPGKSRSRRAPSRRSTRHRCRRASGLPTRSPPARSARPAR